ncbi:hypothetical protein DL767_010449 [Monosporascus sp. MG133]|nr:hypothetical protein DL767_010449 [Monosporascus sp. MG133]
MAFPDQPDDSIFRGIAQERNGYNEYCQLAVRRIFDPSSKNIEQYYRRHPYYPATALVIEMASFLHDLEANKDIQVAFLRDLILLSGTLETESSENLHHANTTIVDAWLSSLRNLDGHLREHQEERLLQVALLRRLLCASGGKPAKWMDEYILKSVPSRNLELLGEAIDVRGRYASTATDIERISKMLTGHPLFRGTSVSKEALQARLRVLQRHVPITYPDIGLPPSVLFDVTYERIQAFRLHEQRIYRTFPSLKTKENRKWMFLLWIPDATGHFVEFVRTDAGFRYFFQQAIDQIRDGQEHNQVVLCLLTMLRYQELVSPAQEQNKPFPHPYVVEDFCVVEEFCELLRNTRISDIRKTVGYMVHSILNVITDKEELEDFIWNTMDLRDYRKSADTKIDVFWRCYLEKGIDAAIRETIGKGGIDYARGMGMHFHDRCRPQDSAVGAFAAVPSPEAPRLTDLVIPVRCRAAVGRNRPVQPLVSAEVASPFGDLAAFGPPGDGPEGHRIDGPSVAPSSASVPLLTRLAEEAQEHRRPPPQEEEAPPGPAAREAAPLVRSLLPRPLPSLHHPHGSDVCYDCARMRHGCVPVRLSDAPEVRAAVAAFEAAAKFESDDDDARIEFDMASNVALHAFRPYPERGAAAAAPAPALAPVGAALSSRIC